MVDIERNGRWRMNCLQIAQVRIAETLGSQGIDMTGDPVRLNREYSRVFTTGRTNGVIFKAQLYPDWYPHIPHTVGGSAKGPTAIVQSLRVPERPDVERALATAWETTLSDLGVTRFAVTEPQSVELWEKLGYQIPDSQRHMQTPYVVYKNSFQ